MSAHAGFDLSGRSAVVTGAGGGLGRAFAKALAGRGASVLCADIDDGGAQDTVQQISNLGGTARAVQIDVADEGSVGKLTALFTPDGSTLDILINNAGVAAVPCRLLDHSTQEWDRLFSVNLRGMFLVTRGLLPALLRSGRGSVINLSSYLGLQGAYAGFPVTSIAYSASKAGVAGFTRQLAAEYARDGLRANCIAPGWHFGTNLGQARRAQSTPGDDERFLAFARGTIPMDRFGAPEDLCGLVEYLAGDASSYMTGQVFAHDGGITAV